MGWKTCLLLAGSVAACSPDPREIVREAEAVRGECTEERLARSDEECVRMMERAAETMQRTMGTSVGAVRALDRALERMPPAQWDTAGLGHALTVDPDALPGSRHRMRNAWPTEKERAPSPRGYEEPYPRDSDRRTAFPEPWEAEYEYDRGYEGRSEGERSEDEYRYETGRFDMDFDRADWEDEERDDFERSDPRSADPDPDADRRDLPRHAGPEYELTPYQRHRQRREGGRSPQPPPREYEDRESIRRRPNN